MQKRLQSAAIVLAISMQPLCIHAGGERPSATDYMVGGAMLGVAVGYVYWRSLPDSDETLIKKARDLHNRTSAKIKQQYSDGEDTCEHFARSHIGSQSFDKVHEHYTRECNEMHNIRSQLYDRMKKRDRSSLAYAVMDECAEALDESIQVLNARITYMDRHTGYFRLYSADQRASYLFQRGCPSGDVPCKADYREAIDDVQRYKNFSGLGRRSALYKRVDEVTLPRLNEEFRAIDKRIEDAEQARRNAAFAWGMFKFGAAVYQASVEAQQNQPQPQSVNSAPTRSHTNNGYVNDQAEAVRNAKAQQQAQDLRNSEEAAVQEAKRRSKITAAAEQEKRDLEQAKQESLKTHQQEQAKRSNMSQRELHKDCDQFECKAGDGSREARCPVRHRNCLANRCLRGLSADQCRAAKVDHTRCSYDTCYNGSAADCPKYQAHKDCNRSWCNYHKDSMCPRFHDRSRLNPSR